MNESAEHDTTPPAQRASNRGYLPISFAEYVSFADWTGREIRSNKRGTIPAELAPIFERLRINGEVWVDAICNFSRWFKTVVGRAEKLAEEANRAGSDGECLFLVVHQERRRQRHELVVEDTG